MSITHPHHAAITKKFLSAQDRLVVQASDMSLQTLSQMVGAGSIDITPSYQRRERWSTIQQSQLIESFLLNVPIPPVYLAEESFGVYSIIDGKQRLTSIHNYLSNSLKLTGLEKFPELEGMTFSSLPDEPRNALTVRPYIRAVTLLKQSDPDLKYEVFTRLNRGGEPLNAQEIRNVVFRGPMNSLVYKCSKDPFLRQQLKIKSDRSAAFEQMQDAEIVLRFMTMTQSWSNFSGDYRRSMDAFMRSYRAATPDIVELFETSFFRSLRACQNIWGDTAFKRPVGTGWRDQLLTGMYDAQMIGTYVADDEEIEAAIAHRDSIITQTRDAFADEAFEDSVRVATNTPAKIEHRINTIADILSSASD